MRRWSRRSDRQLRSSSNQWRSSRLKKAKSSLTWSMDSKRSPNSCSGRRDLRYCLANGAKLRLHCFAFHPQNFHACDSEGTEFTLIDLPKQLKPVGPHVKDQTLFQSVATALHTSMHPVTGQTSSKTALSTNPGVFVNPDQPLLYACSISEEDIRKQEDRVQLARKKLQEALAN